MVFNKHNRYAIIIWAYIWEAYIRYTFSVKKLGGLIHWGAYIQSFTVIVVKVVKLFPSFRYVEWSAAQTLLLHASTKVYYGRGRHLQC